VEDEMPSPEYIAQALDCLRPRIVYAGRRLAELMMYIYDDQVKFLSA